MLAFRDYVEGNEGMDNTSRVRSSACIALDPANNSAGLWLLFKIESQSKVWRLNMVKLAATDLVVQAMNTSHGEEEQAKTPPARPQFMNLKNQQSAKAVEEPSKEELSTLPVEATTEAEKDLEPEEKQDDEAVAADEQVESTSRTRSRRNVKMPSRYLPVTKEIGSKMHLTRQ